MEPRATSTYLLPFRRASFDENEARDCARYFRQLTEAGCEVLVIDGSGDAVFQAYDEHWKSLCVHRPVDHGFGYLNGKVNGIHTGMRYATHEKIVVADDDIRYTPALIAGVIARLDQAEVVRPQNFLFPLPWWARLEAARMLINRATLAAADYPGTCAFRRQTMIDAGEYDGDVLFDNEEMIRHFAQAGAKIDYAVDLFVLKRAPIFSKWLEQRPRQAYEDFGLRAKTLFFASLLPALGVLGVCFGITTALLSAAALALVSIGLALAGWRRGRAREFFPVSTCACAPAWIFERCLSTYAAFYWFIARGGYPFGDKLLSKGIGRDWFKGARVAAGEVADVNG